MTSRFLPLRPAAAIAAAMPGGTYRVLLAAGDDDKQTVRGQRRRRTTPPGPGGRERAEAPQRRQQRGSGAGGSSGGQRPPAPGPSGGGPRMKLPWWAVLIILAVVVFGPMIFGGGEDGGGTAFAPDTGGSTLGDAPGGTGDTPELAAPTAVASATPRPAVPAEAAGGAGQTWTIMLYQDADDKILEQDIYVDLNEAERVGSTDRVRIVAQIDRYTAGYTGDGDWTGARRFLVEQDGDLRAVGSPTAQDLGEVSMADADTLISFVTWAAATYPADNYVLILSDHGMGWPGGWTDKDPDLRNDGGTPLASALGQALYLDELDDALETIRGRTGIEQFALIGMDACLMGHVEVFAALAPHAQYGVASQEVEPALGWAYTGFLDELVRNPDMSPAQLAQGIVTTYINEDQRIVDDQARAEMLGRGSPVGGLFGLLLGGGSGGGATVSASQLAAQMSENVTLTAVDLSQMPALIDSLNSLSLALQGANQQAVARARTYAQSFTSVFGSNVPPSYIDLGHFAQLLERESGSSAVAQAAEDVQAAIDAAVVAEKHGPKKPGATGISVYFPNSQLYQNPATGPQSYTAIARRFADASLWDDFLAFHYAGRGFDAGTRALAVPEAGANTRAPGAEPIDVTPLLLSGNEVAPGDTILMSTDITGQNIGHIFLFTGFVDRAANAIFVADSDYLESADTREIGGVFYPVWPEGETFTFEFEWEPVVFGISDGVTTEVALFNPESYGESFEEATYSVDGIYTYADGGEQRYARLYFQNGIMRQVFGFNNGTAETGAPREIMPQTGDQFTILERWMDLNSSGGVQQVATQPGGTLTFGDQPFIWETLDAAAGTYVIGFIVSDLDGNRYPVYETVTVR